MINGVTNLKTEIKSNYENLINSNNKETKVKSFLPDDSFIKASSKEQREGDTFFSKMKKLASKETSVYKKTASAYKAKETETNDFGFEIKGAILGGAVGTVVGGFAGFNSAMSEIKKLPIESVTLEWQKPVTIQKVLGKIPEDYYERNYFGISIGNPISMTNVRREVPVLKDSGPVMQDTEKIFSDHGKPVVEWKTREINDMTLKGYSESKWEDGHYETVLDGHDSEGKEITHQVYKIDGWRHTYSPNIDYKNIGTYKEPVVKFETGVDVLGKTVTGALIGLGAGAASGAIAAAVLKRMMPTEA